MLEALWSVEFVSNVGSFGAGVVVFETGRIYGGDGAYFYIGKYSTNSGVITGEVEIAHYAGVPLSIFGNLKKFGVHLTGKVQKPVMELRGSIISRSDLQLTVKCTHRADLS